VQGALSGMNNKALAGIVSDVPAFALPTVKFAAKVKTDLENSTAAVENFTVNLPKSNAGGNADVNWGGKNLAYSSSVKFNLFIDELAAVVPQMTAEYKLAGTAAGNITTTDANLAKGAVKLTGLGTSYGNVAALKDTSGNITINSVDNVKTDTFKGTLNDAGFTGDFSYLKIAANRFKINMNFNLDSLTMKEFPASSPSGGASAAASSPSSALPKFDPKAPVFDVTGNITVGKITVPYFTSGGANLTADITGAEPSMTQLNGPVNFTVQAGQITDLNLFLNSNKIVRVLFVAVGVVQKAAAFLNIDALKGAQTNNIPFDSIEGAYVFKNGVMNINKSALVSSLTTVNAGGTVDFPADKINMTINAQLGKSEKPVLIKVGGTTANPKPSLDVLGTATSVLGSGAGGDAKQAVSATVDSAKTALKGITGLFKK